ncbi:MAG: HD domain-containing protein [Nanoarchaeota archaeon]|nr:HD domain-containing protein [Nanoarchaeota archaeon]
MKPVKELFEEHVKSNEIRMHCLEVGTIMRFLAREFNEDEEKWYTIGLLHDLDFETEKDLKTHGLKTAEILRKEGYDEALINSILSHNEGGLGVKRESKLDYALSAADNISGLIYSYGLMRKGLEGMEVSGLKKKFKAPAFAAAVRRDLIADIEKTGMTFDKFFEISIKAMQSIAKEIGFEK